MNVSTVVTVPPTGFVTVSVYCVGGAVDTTTLTEADAFKTPAFIQVILYV